MTLHLLDSDAVIDALKGIRSTLDFLQNLVNGGNTLCTNAVVLCEVYAGLHAQDERAGDRFLATLTCLAISERAGRQAGRWKYQYARQGTTLAHTDCLIAACAEEHRATLITGNLKDFPMAGTGSVSVLPLPRVSRGQR